MIDISPKYKPLFELLNGLHPDVDTVFMTGGRASGKSFAVGLWSITALKDFGYNILYTRYTNSSIVDSIKPEVSDKIDLLGVSEAVNDTQTHIECGENRISFKGIKAGSKIQTANLKSLSGFNVFIVDEAEELPDKETYKKVFYSIRSAKKRNLTILILNPTSREHWLYNEFIESKNIPDGFNGVHENVMYIHTSYLDVNPKYIPINIVKDYDRMKQDDPIGYDNIVLGGWIKEVEGLLLPKSSLSFDDLTQLDESTSAFRFAVGDPADTGGDKFSIPFMYVLSSEDKILCCVKSVIFNTDGIQANSQRILNRCKDLNISDVWIEVNGVGLSSFHQLKEKSKNIRINALNSSTNKEVRILSNYEFIRDNFVFCQKEYESNPEYKSFINDLTSYIKGAENKHAKDAIDSLCTAVIILQSKFRSVLNNF